MPQVQGSAIKARAAKLRAAGEAQVTKHLTAQVGRAHHILMENPRMGRTEQFAEVVFDTDQIESSIVEAEIKSVADTQLVA